MLLPVGPHPASEIGCQPVRRMERPHLAQLDLSQRIELPIDLQKQTGEEDKNLNITDFTVNVQDLTT